MAPNQIRQILYQLQKQFGANIDFYHIVSKTVDDVTGKTVVVKEKFIIKKVIKLPNSQIRKMLLGGQYDKDEVVFLFGKNRLSSNFVISEEDYFIYKSSRFNVKEIKSWVSDLAYEVTAIAMESAPLEEIKEINIIDRVVVRQEVENA